MYYYQFLSEDTQNAACFNGFQGAHCLVSSWYPLHACIVNLVIGENDLFFVIK